MTNAKGPTFEAQDKFRRSYLDAMKNMATVSAYAFAAHYLFTRVYDGAWQHAMGVVAGTILSAVGVFGAFAATDLIGIAFATRFPSAIRNKIVRMVAWIVMAIIALAPAYVSSFRGA